MSAGHTNTMYPSPEITAKLVIAREAILISQNKLAKITGFNQGSLSQTEMGKMKYVSHTYLAYLASKGINITRIYDPQVTPDQFRKETFASSTATESCKRCDEKDELINILKDTIKDLRKNK